MRDLRNVSVFLEGKYKKVEAGKIEDFCKKRLESSEDDVYEKKREAQILIECLPDITQIYITKIQSSTIHMFDRPKNCKIEFNPTQEFIDFIEKA